ncbi:hypothetical protein, conserved [Babesia bigemina]|uniref:Uncharacterized protein n=1 Tax=Babesia bigemina TaxID=5866 RepID=A0A061D353_BABBI|nr:hypothetical protein, conserved [Babesia bigemina]CDR95186.1 hypothetical protein, conserved [Babesia bigemina]|eukprot:XP_012767372.1 hypothetical protein, conserved [Babesia bigemina]
MKKLNSVYEEFTNHLSKAAFVTADCELSGLAGDRKGITKLDDYLLLLREGAATYSLLQVGFCIAVYDTEADDGSWILYPYNFYLYPAEVSCPDPCLEAAAPTTPTSLHGCTQDTDMHLNSGTVKWLKQQGFDFARWIDEGVAYQRVDEVNNTGSKTKRQRIACRWGIQRFLEAVSQHGKPLVVHNGLLDLFHLYDKLIGELPTSASEIVRSFGKRFAPAVYDTKATARYLDSKGIYVLDGLFNLEHLYHEMDKTAKFAQTIRIGDTASALDYASLITNPPKPKDPERSSLDLLHEAGFDATVTAMVFTAEIRLLQEADGLPKHFVPSDFTEAISSSCTHFRTVINRVNIHDEIEEGFVQLPREQ